MVEIFDLLRRQRSRGAGLQRLASDGSPRTRATVSWAIVIMAAAPTRDYLLRIANWITTFLRVVVVPGCLQSTLAPPATSN